MRSFDPAESAGGSVGLADAVDAPAPDVEPAGAVEEGDDVGAAGGAGCGCWGDCS